MGIWIRSQDKSFLKETKEFIIHTRSKNLKGDKCDYVISSQEYTGLDFGVYSTEEKALKVLDMIEQALTGTITVENIELNKLEILKEELKQKPTISTKPLKDLEYKIYNREFVFQMPDDEVKENE